MSTTQLKSELHKMLDSIESESLLRALYDFLKMNDTATEGHIWKTLTEDQKKQVYLSYEESENPDNLIDWDKVKGK
jgi:hypothetical protein